MLDPIPPPAPWLFNAIEPLADKLGLYALPYHIHEMIFAFLLYLSVQFIVSPVISSYFFPNVYPKLPRKTQVNWDVHVVSFVQACLVNSVALWVIFTDQERRDMNAMERVYGYTGACGLVGALGAGYFLWDLIISARYLQLFGPGILAHAVCAFCVFNTGFRPYLHYYGSPFILYELSSPFLNIHWFLDKIHMTGSTLQWYNGAILLATFGGSRLLWGTYQSIRVYQDIWTALQTPDNATVAEAISHVVTASASSKILTPKDGSMCLGDTTCIAATAEVLKLINKTKRIPTWLAMSTLISNVVLNGLNVYWYAKMIRTVRSRFDGSPDPGAEKDQLGIEGVAGGEGAEAISSGIDGDTKTRKRG